MRLDVRICNSGQFEADPNGIALGHQHSKRRRIRPYAPKVLMAIEQKSTPVLQCEVAKFG